MRVAIRHNYAVHGVLMYWRAVDGWASIWDYIGDVLTLFSTDYPWSVSLRYWWFHLVDFGHKNYKRIRKPQLKRSGGQLLDSCCLALVYVRITRRCRFNCIAWLHVVVEKASTSCSVMTSMFFVGLLITSRHKQSQMFANLW